MKRHVQQAGVRKFFGGDFIEMQEEGLKILDGFFGEYGQSIIQGCRVTPATNGLFNISAGIVALAVVDPNTDVESIKVMPFEGAESVALPVYLVAEVTPVLRIYNDSKMKPIAYNYKAVLSGNEPLTSFIEITQSDTIRFVDAIQDESHNFITSHERIKWNSVLNQAKEYADNKDTDRLAEAKEYADQIVAELVNSSPDALDTLKELANAMGNDPNFATTVLNQLAGKANTTHEHPDLEAFAGHRFSSNGYQKFSNGLMIQWGVDATNGDHCGTNFLPMTFTNVFSVVGTMLSNEWGDANLTFRARNVYNTHFLSVKTYVTDGGHNGYSGFQAKWIAIGTWK